jgi:hypothetical protein
MEHVCDLYQDGPSRLESDFGVFRGPDDRPYRIIALHCHQTYAFCSLLYGIPRPSHNEKALVAIRQYCAKLRPPPNDSHLVHFEQPPLIPMKHPNPLSDDTGARLPKYFVVVDVESDGIAAHADCDFSSLRCVYFFDRFDPAALMGEIGRRTVALPWEKLAHAWNP